MVKKKVIFIVIDGMADLPINGKTPLSEARKPNLDYFAKNGVLGEIIPVEKSQWTETAAGSISHVANLGLLGYDAKNYKIKRGPLEAVGADLPFVQGQLAIRCNFATVDKNLTVIDRRAGRNTFGLDEIARYVNENVKIGPDFVFIRTYGHRASLVIKEKLSDKITDSDSIIGGKVGRIEALAPEAEKSAKVVQDFLDKSRQVIEFHPFNEQRIKNGMPPANYILTREAGNSLPELKPNFLKNYNIKAVCISENGVMKATCLLAGFSAITVPETKFESSLKFIFDNIEDSLAEYDFVYAHIKGPDEPAHDGDFHKKREMIEQIDEMLENFRDFNGIIVITCDHITSSKLRKHVYGAVPLLVFGKGKGRSKTFDEFEAKKGKLKIMTGKKLMKFVIGK